LLNIAIHFNLRFSFCPKILNRLLPETTVYHLAENLLL
jgi:hypothetical protein